MAAIEPTVVMAARVLDQRTLLAFTFAASKTGIPAVATTPATPPLRGMARARGTNSATSPTSDQHLTRVVSRTLRWQVEPSRLVIRATIAWWLSTFSDIVHSAPAAASGLVV